MVTAGVQAAHCDGGGHPCLSQRTARPARLAGSTHFSSSQPPLQRKLSKVPTCLRGEACGRRRLRGRTSCSAESEATGNKADMPGTSRQDLPRASCCSRREALAYTALSGGT